MVYAKTKDKDNLKMHLTIAKKYYDKEYISATILITMLYGGYIINL